MHLWPMIFVHILKGICFPKSNLALFLIKFLLCFSILELKLRRVLLGVGCWDRGDVLIILARHPEGLIGLCMNENKFLHSWTRNL